MNLTMGSIVSTAKGLIKDKPIRLETDIEFDLPQVWGINAVFAKFS